MKDPLEALKNSRASWKDIYWLISETIAKVVKGEDLSDIRLVTVSEGGDFPVDSPRAWVWHSKRTITTHAFIPYHPRKKLIAWGDYYSHLFYMIGELVTSTVQERVEATNWTGWHGLFKGLSTDEKEFIISINLGGLAPHQIQYRRLVRAHLELRARLFGICLAEQLFSDYPESELAKHIYRSAWWSAFWDDGNDDTAPAACLVWLLGTHGASPLLVNGIVQQHVTTFVDEVKRAIATRTSVGVLETRIVRRLESRLPGVMKKHGIGADLGLMNFAMATKETCATLSIDDAWASLQAMEKRPVVTAIREKNWRELATLLHQNKRIRNGVGADHALVNLVLVYENTGRNDDARALLRGILEAFPNSFIARKTLQGLR